MIFHAMSRRGSAAGLRARLRLRGSRVWLVAGLVGAAAALHNSIGVLLAIMALLVLLDAAVPVPGERWAHAEDRFRRLVRSRRAADRMRRLRGLGPARLDVLDDRAGWASTAPRRRRGIELIAIDTITGTAEEAKAAAFDRSFRPDWSCRARWEGIWLAHAHGASMPPISVYLVDGQHIVRDGHHRVSVARERGLSAIEAEVVELRRPADR